MKNRIQQLIEKSGLKIDLLDFPTIEQAYPNSLRFELGDNLENGTVERVNQATHRACTIFNSFFETDKLIVLTYDWYEEGDSLARTELYLYEILGVDKPTEMEKLALMHFPKEEIEYEDGALGVFEVSKKTVTWEKIINAIANTDMGFDPTIHQITYVFSHDLKQLFWMYDDRGCLLATTEKELLKPQFGKFKDWLCGEYENLFD